MLYFDLWTLLVDQLLGGFWISVACLVGIIFLIMAVLGKMSKFSVTYYCTLFLFVMFFGFGLKSLATIILFGYLVWLYITFKNTTGG